MKNFTLLMIAFVLGGCGEGEAETETVVELEAESSRHGYEEVLDTARGVEEEVLNAAERQREIIEEQGG